MIPLSPSTLSPQAQKIVAPTAPEKLQEMAARGVVPGIRPNELVAILLLLTTSERPTVAQTAERTLSALPEVVLSGALAMDLLPQAVDALADRYADRFEVVERLLAMPQIDPDTVATLAAVGDERLTELIATNEERLLAHPRIIEKLYLNKRTRMSTADRIIELAARNGVECTGLSVWKEAAQAVAGELIAEPSDEPTPDDLLFLETQEIAEQLASQLDEDTHLEDDTGDERIREKFLPLYARIAQMTVSQRIRRATLGTKEERMLLVRDRNRIVATAAVHSPLLQESDAALISRNRNMSDAVLREIGKNPEMMKSYSVKRNLVENPKTPVMLATRLIQHLREADLRSIAKSKNVTGAVADAARRHLARRKT